MRERTVTLTAVGTGGVVENEHFGGNFLFNSYSLESDSLERYSIEYAGITDLRYPGGGVSEEYFDVKNPNSLSIIHEVDGDRITPAPFDKFMEYAGQYGHSVTIVIPMDHFIIPDEDHARQVRATDYKTDLNYDQDDLARFINQSILYANAYGVEITAFELGNEYWGRDDRSPIQRTTDYGAQAAHAAVIIEDVLSSRNLPEADRPAIIAQLGAFAAGRNRLDEVLWDNLGMREANSLIISEFQNVVGALSAVDGLVSHRYQNHFTEMFDVAIGHGLLSEWKEAIRDVGGDPSSIQMHWTEWNAHNGGMSEEYGLRGASNIIAMFHQAMAYRHQNNDLVASMNIWPVGGGNRNSLVRQDGDDFLLTATGKAFRMMSETLIGTRSVTIDTPEWNIQRITGVRDSNGDGRINRYDDMIGNQIRVDAFEREGEKVVVFLSNRTDQRQSFDLELGDLTNDYHHVWALSLDTAGPGARNERDVDTLMRGMSAQDLFIDADPMMDITLAPYEVTRLVFTIENHGVVMEGDFQDDFGDRLIGSKFDDRIHGFGGDDVLFGGRGEDTLRGGDGSDILRGGYGQDWIAGNAGDDSLHGWHHADSLYGGAGRDTLFGGEGGDNLLGGTGQDLILGGSGNDQVHGGRQSDTLIGHNGDDTMRGGDGNDVLRGQDGRDLISGGRGNDIINGGDGFGAISLDGDRDTLSGGSGSDTFVFRDIAGSKLGARNRDVILDFDDRSDVIHLGHIDANTLTAGIQDFVFSGNRAQANSVWYVKEGENMILRGDNNGDGRHDFAIEIQNITRLMADDFIF